MRRSASASALVGLVLLLGAGARAEMPRLERSVGYLDSLLSRPYAGDAVFRSSGRTLWATHPTGWGFANDVHHIHLNRLEPFALALEWGGWPVEPGAAWSWASHVETVVEPIDPDAGVPLELAESKFIARDDVLVCVVSVRNLREPLGDAFRQGHERLRD